MPSERIQINILFAKKPAMLLGESNKLSSYAQKLLSGLEGSENKCPHGFILDPVLKRVDINLDTSIAEMVERSPLISPTFPGDYKRNKEHLKEVTIPQKILQGTSQKSDSLFTVAINSMSDDSLIVLTSDKRVDSLTINGKRIKAYLEADEVRSRMLTILCQNPKARIAIIIDPPVPANTPKMRITSITPDCEKGQLTVATDGGDGSPITFRVNGLKSGSIAGTFVIERNQRNGSKFTFYAIQKGATAEATYETSCPQSSHELTIPPRQVVWNRVPGSEFCVGECIQAYSERSNLGRLREKRIRNCADCKSADKETR